MSNPVMDLKHELLAAAERQHQSAPAPVKERRFRGSARVSRLLPIAAAVAVVAAAVLFFTARNSKQQPTVPRPQLVSFLVRTEAALTPPKDMILHAKLVSTSCLGKVRWTAEFWADEHTQRYRGLFHDPLLPYPFRYFTLRELHGKLSCERGSTYEAGVVLGPRNYLVWSEQQQAFVRSHSSLRFVPPNKLYRYPVDAPLDIFGRVPALDPAVAVRSAIRDGRAHDQGRTKLDGRTVERIRVDPCPPNKPAACRATLTQFGGYAYVDPKTHYPIEIRLAESAGFVTHFSTSEYLPRSASAVTRFSIYEYLPRTPANLALTNIRAQHPHAGVTARG